MIVAFESEEDALESLSNTLTKPSWMEGRESLPFEALRHDEFEVFSYLALIRIEKDAKVVLYRGPGDEGRDIVVVREGEPPVLVQCKHYAKNVGVAEVRGELAKLFAATFGREESERPQVVRFLATQGFTPKATSLTQSRSEWMACAQVALEKHLGSAPTAALARFAETWWPDIELWPGVRLTNEVAEMQDLVRRFFRLRSVITGDAKHLENQLDVLTEQVRLTNQLAGANLPEGMRRLIDDAQASNPGLRFDVGFNEKAMSVRVSSTGDGNVALGTLKFPRTAGGEVGKEKVRRLIEGGFDAVLERGEFAWSSNLNLPPGLAHPSSKADRMRLSAEVPQKCVPVCLRVESGEVEFAKAEYVNFRILRMGTHQIEVEFFGGKLAGSFRVASDFGAEEHELSFELRIGGQDLNKVAVTLRVLAALMEGGVLVADALETGARIFESETGVGEELSAEAKRMRMSLELVEKMIVISNATGAGLQYPADPPDIGFAADVEVFFQGVQHGCVHQTDVTRTLEIPINGERALHFADLAEQGRQIDIPIHSTLRTHRLGDAEVELGPVQLIYRDVKMGVSPQELRAIAEKAAEGGSVDIEVSSSSILWEFLDFVKPAE